MNSFLKALAMCTFITLSTQQAESASFELPALNEDKIVRSPANPNYYYEKNDINLTRIPINLTESKTEFTIARFGKIDIARMINFVNRLPQPLHSNINKLFFEKLIPLYTKNPHVGNSQASINVPSSGWFGGISTRTLLMLDDLAHVQEELPVDQKMKFLGVGSGRGFFEMLLSHVGQTSAMDVLDKLQEPDFINWIMAISSGMSLPQPACAVLDYSDLARAEITDSFFMPVTIHKASFDEKKARQIVEDTFRECDFNNTILVLSWPRTYGNAYIAHYIKNNGKGILIVRGEFVEGAFSPTHLGEPLPRTPAGNVQFALNAKGYKNISFKLNTATFSEVEFYYLGESHPFVDALQRTISRIR